mmetsp:Transcript_25810/g.103099  ORF Transcript_25810/g.103099 Transcript_25810/m.103099 type:complete len:389 (-) Transcript_25810:818-1984(-)
MRLRALLRPRRNGDARPALCDLAVGVLRELHRRGRGLGSEARHGVRRHRPHVAARRREPRRLSADVLSRRAGRSLDRHSSDQGGARVQRAGGLARGDAAGVRRAHATRVLAARARESPIRTQHHHHPVGPEAQVQDRSDYAERGVRSLQGAVSRQGFTQIEGIDYFEVYAPVSAAVTLRLFLVFVALHDLELHKFDVSLAFINANVNDADPGRDVEIYVWPPKGFAPRQPTDGTAILYKVQRSWYGLRQSPRAWQNKLRAWLLTQGFTRAEADHCLYFYRRGGVVLLMTVIVVDDLLVAHSASNQGYYDSFFAAFKEFVNVREVSPSLYVGLWILRNRPNRRIIVKQTNAIKKLLQDHRLDDCKAHRDNPAPQGPRVVDRRLPEGRLR